jgi:hypothetical protein
MNDIQTVLRIATRRLELTSLLAHAHLAAIALAGIVLALLVIERLGPATFWPWAWVVPVLVAVAMLITVRLWFARRRSEIQVAVEVDRRLDLREKLSTALHCRQRADAFAQAAVEDAVTTARDPKVRERLHRQFAVQSPPRWWLSPLLVLAAVGVWFVPPLDVFGRDDEPDDSTITQTVHQRNEAIEAVIKPIEESPELREELSDILGELSNDGSDPDALRTREDVRRDAIKKLTDLNKRLDEITNGPKGMAAEAMKRSLEQLQTPQEGPAKDLAEALAKGDFKAAQQALAKLQADAANGKLAEKQQEQLAKQLEDIAKQLEQLGKQQQQLEQLLQQAGLDPNLAQNLDALQAEIDKNPNLNEQQKQQLQQMAQAQQQAAQMMQGLQQGMQQMAQACQQGQFGEFGEGGQQAANQLNQLEALQQLLQQAQAAANAAQGQCQGLGQGLGMQQAMKWWMNQPGGAFGNRGQGEGGKAPIAPTPTGKKIVKANTKTGQGDIIARQFIDGPQIVGESRAQLHQVAVAVSEGYDEAQSEEQIPPKYVDAHKHYFGEWKKLVEAVQREVDEKNGTGEDTKSTEDAEETDDP